MILLFQSIHQERLALVLRDEQLAFNLSNSKAEYYNSF